MQDILIVAHFTQVPGETGNGRFKYIAERINKEKSNVEVVTTSFSHQTKAQRILTNQSFNSIDYKLTMLYEPGYKKNVSLSRFYSHYLFSRSLKKYLRKRDKPDKIYCAVPSLDVGKVVAKHAKKYNIELIIDVQDLWPEAFKMIFNFPFLSDILFYPMRKKADYIYKVADLVITVSETYLHRVATQNNNCYSVYLGTELEYYDIIEDLEKPSNELWIAYVGTLGHSYDIPTVVDAIYILQNEYNINNLKLIVMGDGPLKLQYEEYARHKNISVEFTGRLKYKKMVGLLKACDLAVNPIKSGSAGSIINKVGDYAAAGLPVINTQDNLEYMSLVQSYNIGFNCKNSDINDIANKILTLMCNQTMRKKMGENNRSLAEDKFNRKKTYTKILDDLESNFTL
ncbi:glycosyltransferase family 4 protein [Virgibacillus dokdonensis]|uniref:glycosyltransferase family 4 protein n=1 Tax=Virgibacillus dokdonensis TaxID=302167 RepID=UPI00098A4D73|nr:glycosyltransferase family 4 protein [Virgibacillus dokdonensis]